MTLYRITRMARAASDLPHAQALPLQNPHLHHALRQNHRSLTSRLRFQPVNRLSFPAAATTVVHAYQRLGAGHWILYDCVNSSPPPALMPVLESHIRRHDKPPWPEHDQDCDFYRDHLKQHAITRGFARNGTGTRSR
jgi:hypothetical protein